MFPKPFFARHPSVSRIRRRGTRVKLFIKRRYNRGDAFDPLLLPFPLAKNMPPAKLSAGPETRR